MFQRSSQTGNDDKFLKSLAKDYMESKDQETSKLIRAQRAKVSQKLLICRSMKQSKLEVNGADVQGKESRTEMAKVIGRKKESAVMNDEDFFQLWHGTSANQYCNHISIAQKAPSQLPEYMPHCLAGVVSLKMD